jgi:DNA primase small subunit
MDEKGWKGAELIFDIDADSIPTPCKVRHTWWYCQSCHKGGMGTKPAKCPGCQLPGAAQQVHWSCQECLNATREHIVRLVDFLVEDFGMSRQQIRTYFSGSRGYHAHVKDERFETADPPIRAEIANYVKGTGFNVKSVPSDVRASGSGMFSSSTSSSASSGWGRRTNLFLSTFAPTASTKKNQKLAEQVALVNAALIDESVTTDIHRVFRMPGTLHGNSGLLKKRVESLERFDPQIEPVVLSGEEVRARIYYSPEFSLNGVKFGPYDSTTVQIPIYAAVFLLARGLGRVA